MKSLVKAILLLCLLMSISSTNMRTKSIVGVLKKIGQKIVDALHFAVDTYCVAFFTIIFSTIYFPFLGAISVYQGFIDMLVTDFKSLSKGPVKAIAGIVSSIPLLPVNIIRHIIQGIIIFSNELVAYAETFFGNTPEAVHAHEVFANTTLKQTALKVLELEQVINKKKNDE